MNHTCRSLAFALALATAWPAIAGEAPASALAPAAASQSAPSYFHKYLKGSIGPKRGVRFELKNVDGQLSGHCQYAPQRMALDLFGRIDPSGSFTLKESLGSRITGTFTGTVVNGHRIAGTWRSADGQRALPFLAEQTSEIVIGSKGDILDAAMGNYPLQGISGSGGANSMWDTWHEGTRWRSNMSGMSGGMREATETKLTQADQRLLDQLRIVVGADRSVRLMSGARTVLDIPFQPDGMPYDLPGQRGDIALEPLNKLSPHTTVQDEQLYLLVGGGIDHAEGPLGRFIMGTEDILVVSHSVADRNFQVRFIDSACCGSTLWTFGPRKP